jgi:hypothetical protein
MNVCIGLTNIASQYQDLRFGFESIGYKATLVCDGLRNLSYVDEDYDINLQDKFRPWIHYVRPRRFRSLVYNKFGNYKVHILRMLAKKCDVFFFMWNTFYPSCEDLKYIKDKGKKIVFFFVGSDVRWNPAHKQEFDKYKLRPLEQDWLCNPEHLQQKLTYVRMAEKYADLIIATQEYSQILLRPYMLTPGFLKLDCVKVNTNQREVPHIIHSPSVQAAKGTRHILPVVEKLKEAGLQFDFTFVKDLSYQKALVKYSESDILVGQLFCQGGGKQEREAMAAGTVVLSAYNRDYLKQNFYQSPIVDVTVDSLCEELGSVIKDIARRKQLAKDGVEFAQEYLDVVKFSQSVHDELYGRGNPSHYINPTFFKEEYVPKHDWEREIFNKGTDIVRRCDWYEAACGGVGERFGLRF